MIRSFLIFLLIISIAGVVGSELLLIYAMVKKNARISTRTAGKYIMAFLIMLVVLVMILMALGQQGFFT